MTALIEKLGLWSREDTANIAVLSGLDDTSTETQIVEAIKWMYHSRVRQGLKAKIGYAAKRVNLDGSFSVLDDYSTPTWDLLVTEFAKELDVYDDSSELIQLEEYVSHAVIIQALKVMSPADRAKFFNQPLNLADILDNANIKGPDTRGPQTALALISGAKISGFSVYMASTTALGFASSAVGVTLPYAAYTGLTSTISMMTGPVGFTGALLWGAWKFTGPDWKKLAPVLLYIISHDARMMILEEEHQ